MQNSPRLQDEFHLDCTFDINSLPDLVGCHAAAQLQRYGDTAAGYGNFARQCDIARKLHTPTRLHEEDHTLIRAYRHNQPDDLVGFAWAQHVMLGGYRTYNIACLTTLEETCGRPVPGDLKTQLFETSLSLCKPEVELVTAHAHAHETDFFTRYNMVNGQILMGDIARSRLPVKGLFQEDMALLVIPAGIFVPNQKRPLNLS